jgi:hypothetical protein
MVWRNALLRIALALIVIAAARRRESRSSLADEASRGVNIDKARN